MNSEIQNIQLQFQCAANWNEMQPVNGGRHCNQCNKTVYNFTNARQQEFLQIMAEQSGHICGRFQQQQMAPQPIIMSGWKKWISAALVLIGINIFQHAHAQEIKINKSDIKPNDGKQQSDDGTFVGFVTVARQMPEFPGKEIGWQNFLKQNLHYPKGAKKGRVFANFTIAKDGQVKDIKIIRGLSKINDDEVIRVLQLSPRWKPAWDGNGRTVETAMSMPFNFTGK